MSESFIASALEIQKGRKPDWDLARNHIRSLDAEQVQKVVLDAYQATSLDDIGGKGRNAERFCRNKLLAAVKYLEENYEEHSFDLAYTTICVFGGSSGGDLPDGVDEVTLFCECDAAGAAGFMVPEERKPHDMGLVPCKLMLDIYYDKSKTDAESLATAMDTLLNTAMSTEGILDDYGPVEVGEFFVLTEE